MARDVVTAVSAMNIGVGGGGMRISPPRLTHVSHLPTNSAPGISRCSGGCPRAAFRLLPRAPF